MKYLYILLLVIAITIFYPKNSSKETFQLNKDEIELYTMQLENNITSNIDKLYNYYNYSLNDRQKTFEIVYRGAKLNDAKSQYLLALYYLRDYSGYTIKDYNKSRGIFWLKKASKQNFKEAKMEYEKVK